MGERPGNVSFPFPLCIFCPECWKQLISCRLLCYFLSLYFSFWFVLHYLEQLCTFQVPGATGNFVFIRDAFYKKPDISLLPFPTYLAPEDEDPTQLEPIVADFGDIDPFMAAD